VGPKLFYIEVLMSSSNEFQTLLRESEAKYRGLLEAAPDGMVVVNQDGEIVLLNARAESQFGYRRDELLGQKVTNIIPGGFAERLIADGTRTAAEALAQQIGTGIELSGRRKDGTEFPIEIMLSPQENDEGILVTAAIRDITERKAAESALKEAAKKYRAIFDGALEGMFQFSSDGGLLSANPYLAKMLGYDSLEGVFSTVKDMAREAWAYPDECARFMQEIDEHATIQGFECQFKRKGSSNIWVSLNARKVFGDDGQLLYYEGFATDITKRKVAEERVQFLAYYDALTGLPNRTLLQDRLVKALDSALRRKERVALLFLDLDRFKDINDSFGHSFGDLLLQIIAARFKSGVRKQDTVGRLGGDEFLIVLTNVKEIAYASFVAERLMRAMSAKFVIQGRSLSISCSIGISIFPEDGMDSESLLKNADAAMYSAKESGRNNFRFFAEDMNAQAVERVTLENSLRLALDKKELFLVYQPQMNIATGKIIGLEALLRWQHPTLGIVPPNRFIRIAENCGLIVPIGEWVLRTACAQVRKWQDEGIPVMSIAINVSTVQLRQKDFCELIRSVLNKTGLDPQYLELELTESIFLTDADETLSTIKKLKAMGLTLAIDDFGTGYCNFIYLRQFRISKLKIDRSFIRDVVVNPDYVAITTAIISMAKSLNIKVIAEGVEDEAQMSFLRAHQCDEIQGYYFSKPLAVDKVAAKLRGHIPEPHV
jgi:diguanylate cyclase (GGDEF)-like protein/PAS domain S-box-containing protein